MVAVRARTSALADLGGLPGLRERVSGARRDDICAPIRIA